MFELRKKGKNKLARFWMMRYQRGAHIITASLRRQGGVGSAGFGEYSGYDYFEAFVDTSSVSYVKVVLAIGPHNDWPLYHIDATQAFVETPTYAYRTFL